MTRDEALAILQAAADNANKETYRTRAVKASLRTLLPLSRDRSALDWFWNFSNEPDAIGRSINARSAMNGIRLRLKGAARTSNR